MVQEKLYWQTDSGIICIWDKVASSVYHCFPAVIVRSIFATKAAFNSIHKDVLPIFNQSLLIYKFKCWCNSTYIGRTNQRLEARVRQHVPRGILNNDRLTSGHSQALDSVIGEHLLTINSCRINYQGDWFLFCIELGVKSILTS